MGAPDTRNPAGQGGAREDDQLSGSIVSKSNPDIVRRQARFDYSVVDPDAAALARDKASAIRARHRRVNIEIIETGRDLKAVKDILGHGHFLHWIDAEFGMTDRTARNYMNAAAVFGDKSEIISDFAPATIYALASPSTPPEFRDQVVAAQERGELQYDHAIKMLLVEAKQDKADSDHRRKMRARGRRPSLSPEAQKRADRLAEKKQRESEERQQRRREAMSALVAMIRDRFGADLPVFIDLLDRSGGWGLLGELKGPPVPLRDATPSAPAAAPAQDHDRHDGLSVIPLFLRRGDAP
jgi:hypothetical protein